MSRIVKLFAEQFAPWGIILPDHAIRDQEPGSIQAQGWRIRYQFGADGRGAYLDYYASHRMGDDRHVRIYASGEVEELPAYVGTAFRPAGATPEEDAEVVRRLAEHNARVTEELAAKGFDELTDSPMPRYAWSRLSPLQVGRYAEYFAKMEFTLYGFDVYSAEVDERGIDFVIRRSDIHFYDVQVKSGRHLSYIFFPKDKFRLRTTLLAAVVLFSEGEAPAFYLIPSTAWEQPNALLV
jgi:hypothetical protein